MDGGDFVEQVLRQAEETYQQCMHTRAGTIDLETLAERVAEQLGMKVEQVWSEGKHRAVQTKRLALWITDNNMGGTPTGGVKDGKYYYVN